MFLGVDQRDVRPIVKQMLVGLNGEVPEDVGVMVPDNSFWFYPPVFTVLKVVHIALNTIEATLYCVSQCTWTLRACCSH